MAVMFAPYVCLDTRFVLSPASVRFTPIKVLRRLAAIRAARPTLIVPGDDIAVWQLHPLNENEADLRPLIELSLGAAEAYPAIQQRGEVLRVAQSPSIRVPLTRALAEELKGGNLISQQF